MSSKILSRDQIRAIIELMKSAKIASKHRDELWEDLGDLQDRVNAKPNPTIQVQADLNFLNDQRLIVNPGQAHPLVQFLENAAELASHLKQGAELQGYAKQAQSILAPVPDDPPDLSRSPRVKGQKRFRVALSFPGEHRGAIKPVADVLAGLYGQDLVLYDHFHKAEFARPSLSVYLPELYRTRSELIVILLCPEYAQKRWCKLEWRHIHTLIATTDESRIMFLAAGDPGDLSALGILSGDGYIDITDLPAATIAGYIQERLGDSDDDSDGDHPEPDISRVIHYTPERLIGREAELKRLDDAWADPQTKVLSLVALGGEGKTALVAKWLGELAADGWTTPAFAWSFYSQGTGDKSTASPDLFLAQALTYFGDAQMATSGAHTVDKAKRLVHLLRARRALLILDGLEPLQYAPTHPQRGKLKDSAIATLLRMLAAQNPGLCVLTTRYAVADLQGIGRCYPIKRLSSEAGIAVLQAIGVHGRPDALKDAVTEVQGHALTLNLLGHYLADAHQGDIRRRDRVPFAEADAEVQGGHAFRVMASYVEWFEGSGPKGQRAMAALRLMGLFDRPVAATVFQALLQPPVIEGLTQAVVGLSETQWTLTLKRLEDTQLLTVERDGHVVLSYDAHPLQNDGFAFSDGEILIHFAHEVQFRDCF